VFAVVVLGVWANAGSRRRLAALNQGRTMRRAGDQGQPPSSGGYLGSVD
jgi:hypothetical protein